MRSRDIKPGFFKNDQLAECSFAARLLFPGLWMVADREGRLENRPKKIKAEVFPYDDVDVAALLEELRSHDLIEFYEVNGNKYIWLPTFKTHQSPHKNEKESELPPSPHEKDGTSTDQGCTQNEPFRENGKATNHDANRNNEVNKHVTKTPEITGQEQTKVVTTPEISGKIPLTPSSLTPDLSSLTPDLRERAATADAVASAHGEQYIEFVKEFQLAVAREQGSIAPKVTDSLIDAGAAEIDKCVRIDGLDYDELRRALEWARNDSFWAGNVRSLAQIRKKNRNGTSKAQNIVEQYRRGLVQKIPSRQYLTEGERREANNRLVGERVMAMMEERKRRMANAE